MQSEELLEAAKKFYLSPFEADLRPRNVPEWMTAFALTVTQSQAATIADLKLTRDVHEKQMWEDAMTIKRLTGEVERLRHLFQVIDESYSGGPTTRAGHMLVVFNLVQKALSGGENDGPREIPWTQHHMRERA